nr:unnamed protein product [Digitaria exilis]
MEVAFQSDRRIKTSAPSVQRQEMQRWHPPPVDVLKINTDGSFREKEKDGAWGFVIRDSEGHGVLAGSGRLVAVHDALSAEGEACLAAIHAAMARGISQVIIETDSANLASALRSTSFDQAVGGAIFREARDLLSHGCAGLGVRSVEADTPGSVKCGLYIRERLHHLGRRSLRRSTCRRCTPTSSKMNWPGDAAVLVFDIPTETFQIFPTPPPS